MFLCCGDALFDLFAQDGESAGSIGLAGHVGGSPLNVANGLARLGEPTAYFCKNSTDVFGVRIKRFLELNGVSTEWMLPSDQNSTLAIVETNDQGVPHYVFYTDNTADVSIELAELPSDLPAQVSLVHVGSYSTAVSPTALSLLALVQREQHHRLISYDPNIRPTIEPDIDVWRERFNGFAGASDVIKASDEDIEILFGRSFSLDNFATDAIALGADLVFITRGAEGASVYTRDGRHVSAAGIAVDVVDTVGAGDTFQAACLHGLKEQGAFQGASLSLVNTDLQTLLEFSMTAAAVTCTRHGADLPTREEIAAFESR